MKPGRLGEFMTGILLGLFVETALLAPTTAFVNGILVSMQLLDLFDLSLIGRASADALEYDCVDGSVDTLTFGDLDARSDRVARLIASRGLARGDRLCFFMTNRVEFIDIFLACVKAGVIVVPINALYREREIGHIVANSEPKAVVTTRELAPFVPAGVPVWDVDELAAAADSLEGARIRAALDGDDPGGVVYTSGAMGGTKGAVLTHNNFGANEVNLLAWRLITSEGRYLAV